jgi:endoglucanase
MLCISPNLDRDMYNRIMSVAEKLEYEYQTEIAAGTTGTNADYIAVSRSGVKTAVISVPQKNMHTQAEIVDLNDINETGKLIAAYLRHFSECEENDYE